MVSFSQVPRRPYLVLLICCWSVSAIAHNTGISNVEILIDDSNAVEITLAFKGSDLEKAIGSVFVDQEVGRVRTPELGIASGAIQRYVEEKLVVRADGVLCPVAIGLPNSDKDGVVIDALFSCPSAASTVEYTSQLLLDIDPNSIQNVLILAGDDIDQTVLSRRVNTIILTGDPPTRGKTLGRYMLAGIEHIFIGYDHTAFLLALLLWARRILPVISVVTAFTAAHSVTLALAMFDLVVIPSAIVEPLIAVTVIWAALENYFSQNVGRRWRIALPLGLIHGFGFAGVLAGLGLPTGSLGLALAGFNIGVEIGQALIVAIAVPGLLLMDRVARSTRYSRLTFVRISSTIIAGLGFYWLVTRVLQSIGW